MAGQSNNVLMCTTEESEIMSSCPRRFGSLQFTLRTYSCWVFEKADSSLLRLVIFKLEMFGLKKEINDLAP